MLARWASSEAKVASKLGLVSLYRYYCNLLDSPQRGLFRSRVQELAKLTSARAFRAMACSNTVPTRTTPFIELEKHECRNLRANEKTVLKAATFTDFRLDYTLVYQLAAF